jgi:hypothetical protein
MAEEAWNLSGTLGVNCRAARGFVYGLASVLAFLSHSLSSSDVAGQGESGAAPSSAGGSHFLIRHGVRWLTRSRLSCMWQVAIPTRFAPSASIASAERLHAGLHTLIGGRAGASSSLAHPPLGFSLFYLAPTLSISFPQLPSATVAVTVCYSGSLVLQRIEAGSMCAECFLNETSRRRLSSGGL